MAASPLFTAHGFPDAPLHVDARLLAAGSAESHTVPAGAEYVVFSATGNFYARPGGAAQIPVGDVTDGSAAQLNPALWRLGAVAAIGLAAVDACTITMAFYGRPVGHAY